MVTVRRLRVSTVRTDSSPSVEVVATAADPATVAAVLAHKVVSEARRRCGTRSFPGIYCFTRLPLPVWAISLMIAQSGIARIYFLNGGRCMENQAFRDDKIIVGRVIFCLITSNIRLVVHISRMMQILSVADDVLRS